MARSESEHPTELELEILKILWQESPLPVREVRARLESQAQRRLAHSSVITMLNIMHRKGFLQTAHRGQCVRLFRPRSEKEHVSGKMVMDLLSRVFDGSPAAMVLNLVETSDIDAAELAELRKLIGRKAKEQQK